MDARNENPVFSALLGFLEQPEKCDVKFNVHLVGDAWMPFWGHKLILSIWSPVFAAQFSNEAKDESLSEIDIDGYPPTVFKSFLKFMYGSSEGISDNKENGKFLLNLYKLSEVYQVEQLKKDCRKLLIAATVEIENVFEFLDAANYIGLEIVKLRCFELIKDKTADVMAAQDLRKLTSSMIFTILELNTLSLSSEYDLLTWVFDWAEIECTKTPQTKPQEIIKPFLPYLNFASLKAEQFAALVNKHKEFFSDKDGVRIFLNICDPGPGCMSLPSWHNKVENFRSYKKLTDEVLSNDTQSNTKPVENGNTEPAEISNSEPVEISNAGDVADEPKDGLKDLKNKTPTEFVDQSYNDAISKPDTSANNNNSKVDKLLFKNAKPKEYHIEDAMDELNSLEQVAVSLSDSLLLDGASTHQFEKELNYTSLNGCSTDDSQRVSDYSRFRKIKKKKYKKSYLIPGEKPGLCANSMCVLDDTNTPEGFESMLSLVWLQNRLNSN